MGLVSYNTYVPSQNEILDNCSLCREKLTIETPLVAHTNGGEKHPIHRKCIMQIFEETLNNCPVCRAEFAKDALYSTYFEEKGLILKAIEAKVLSAVVCLDREANLVSIIILLVSGSGFWNASAAFRKGFLGYLDQMYILVNRTIIEEETQKIKIIRSIAITTMLSLTSHWFLNSKYLEVEVASFVGAAVGVMITNSKSLKDRINRLGTKLLNLAHVIGEVAIGIGIAKCVEGNLTGSILIAAGSVISIATMYTPEKKGIYLKLIATK